MYDFPKRLKKMRLEKKLSLEELALKVGTTKGSLSRYERGNVDPTMQMAYKLANVLGVSLDWLVGLGDISTPKTTISDKYIAVAKQAVENNVSSEVLKDALDLIIKINGGGEEQ